MWTPYASFHQNLIVYSIPICFFLFILAADESKLICFAILLDLGSLSFSVYHHMHSLIKQLDERIVGFRMLCILLYAVEFWHKFMLILMTSCIFSVSWISKCRGKWRWRRGELNSLSLWAVLVIEVIPMSRSLKILNTTKLSFLGKLFLFYIIVIGVLKYGVHFFEANMVSFELINCCCVDCGVYLFVPSIQEHTQKFGWLIGCIFELKLVLFF